MSWNTVVVTVSITAMDPGVRSCSGNSKKYYRELIKEGQYLAFDDPSGLLPSIKVLEMKENSLKIEVGKEKVVEIVPFYTIPLSQKGYNYAYFDLEIQLTNKNGPDHVSVYFDDVLAIAKDRYKVFALDSENVNELKAIADGKQNARRLNRNSWYLLGRWYWLTQSDEDSNKKAEELFRRAVEDKCVDALMGLANMYRYGGMGAVDLDKYLELRDEALNYGLKAAKIAYCLDLADGVGCEPDFAAAEEYAKPHVSNEYYAESGWYDAMGWVLLKQGRKEEASKMFLAAVDKDYWAAFDGLLAISHAPEVVIAAMRTGCGKAYSVMAETDTAKYKCAETESEKAELAESIVKNYEKALQMGDVSAARPLSQIHKDGLYGIGKNLSKSLEYVKYFQLIGRR